MSEDETHALMQQNYERWKILSVVGELYKFKTGRCTNFKQI